MNLEILAVALVTALATSLMGVFLVLRKLSMMTDAIAHTVLLGIVLMFLLVRDLHSPWLLFGATVSGVFTVWLIETLRRVRFVKEDAAIGIVMTMLFSLAILILSTSLRRTHLHVETVLLGQLEFVMFERITLPWIGSLPTSLVVLSGVLILNVVFVSLFYKEYKLLSFDRTLAHVLGFSPWVLHYLFMTLVSLTSVAAFNAVGAIMVIAFMVGPVMSARLLTHRMPRLIALTLLMAVFNTIVGYLVAYLWDLNTAASMATMTLFSFLVLLIIAPNHGMVHRLWIHHQQTNTIHLLTLITHLKHHENSAEAAIECDPKTLYEHFNWPQRKTKKLIVKSQKLGYIELKDAMIKVSQEGLHYYRQYTLSL